MAWGTLYIVIGAEAGAVIAFLTARMVGYPLGDEMATEGLEHLSIAALLLGMATLIPLVGRSLWLRLRRSTMATPHEPG